MSNYRIDTNCIHAGYHPGNGEPRVLPIVQSTTYKYETAKNMGQLFDLEASGFFYIRLQIQRWTRWNRKLQPWKAVSEQC